MILTFWQKGYRTILGNPQEMWGHLAVHKRYESYWAIHRRLGTFGNPLEIWIILGNPQEITGHIEQSMRDMGTYWAIYKRYGIYRPYWAIHRTNRAYLAIYGVWTEVKEFYLCVSKALLF